MLLPCYRIDMKKKNVLKAIVVRTDILITTVGVPTLSKT